MSRAEVASLLGWWLEAGVDVAVGEEPRNWLKPAPHPGTEGRRPGEAGSEGAGPGETTSPSVAARQLPQVPGGAAKEHQTLDAFHAWLAETANLPLFRAGAARALPHGPAEAQVMLLTGIPSAEDTDEGRPIGGTAWQLTVRMLAAIGLRPEQAYVAALTCFTGEGKLPASEAEACRDSLLHQIALVSPKRLLLLGDMPARLLIGAPLAQARGRVHRVAGVPTVATFPPRHLLMRPADKALAWRDLLLLMGD